MADKNDPTKPRLSDNSPLERVDVPRSREAGALVSVDRAVGELRRGRTVAVRGASGQDLLVRAAEGIEETEVQDLANLTDGLPALALTATRAKVLGLQGLESGVCVLTRDSGWLADEAAALANPLSHPDEPALKTALQTAVTQVGRHDCWSAGIELAKIARLLPAILGAPPAGRDAQDLLGWARRHDIAWVDAGDVFRHEVAQARTLTHAGESRVPLVAAQDARFHIFRPADGGTEHVAVVIGDPVKTAPVLCRVHSACFTGDLLGSMRCDCGEQLQGAIQQIGEAGSGILLYLAQEGRGIGLVNKLRAYALQDRGFDTLDANEQLGFEQDERTYLAAAQMLRLLGFDAVKLMTNNPLKVAALESCGISVAERVPHAFPSNQHNEAYLRTKASKGGHLF